MPQHKELSSPLLSLPLASPVADNGADVARHPLARSGAGFEVQTDSLRPRAVGGAATGDLVGERGEPEADLEALRRWIWTVEEGLDEAVRDALHVEVALRDGNVALLSEASQRLVGRMDASEAALYAGWRNLDDALFEHAGAVRTEGFDNAQLALEGLGRALLGTAATVVALVEHTCGESASHSGAQRGGTSPSARVRDCLERAGEVLHRTLVNCDAVVELSTQGRSDLTVLAWQHIRLAFSLEHERADQFVLAHLKRRLGSAPVVGEVERWLGLSPSAVGAMDVVGESEQTGDSEYADALARARGRHPELLRKAVGWAEPSPPEAAQMEQMFDLLLEHLSLESPPPVLPRLPVGLLARALTDALAAFSDWWQGAKPPVEASLQWRRARSQVETTLALYRAQGAPRGDLLLAVRRRLDLVDDVVLGSVR